MLFDDDSEESKIELSKNISLAKSHNSLFIYPLKSRMGLLNNIFCVEPSIDEKNKFNINLDTLLNFLIPSFLSKYPKSDVQSIDKNIRYLCSKLEAFVIYTDKDQNVIIKIVHYTSKEEIVKEVHSRDYIGYNNLKSIDNSNNEVGESNKVNLLKNENFQGILSDLKNKLSVKIGIK